MECVSLDAELKKGKNTVSVCPANDDILGLDFVDVISKNCIYDVYYEKLTSRNVKEENAYYLIAPLDSYYKIEGYSDTSPVYINGNEVSGNLAGIYFFSRGYNKIVLPEGSAVTDVLLIDNDEDGQIFIPDDVTLTGEAEISEDANTSTGKHIGWISSETESGIEFKVNAREEGYYAFTIEYANNEEGGYHDYNVDLVERYISIFVNGEKQGNFFFRSTYSWDNYKTKTIYLKLSEGENIITFTNDGSYSFNNKATYAPDIGSITVRPVR